MVQLLTLILVRMVLHSYWQNLQDEHCSLRRIFYSWSWKHLEFYLFSQVKLSTFVPRHRFISLISSINEVATWVALCISNFFGRQSWYANFETHLDIMHKKIWLIFKSSKKDKETFCWHKYHHKDTWWFFSKFEKRCTLWAFVHDNYMVQNKKIQEFSQLWKWH